MGAKVRAEAARQDARKAARAADRAEAESVVAAERQRATQLGRQADDVQELIAKLGHDLVKTAARRIQHGHADASDRA